MGTPKGYIAVSGMMSVNFTVELPVEHCREGMACDDPAKEAAMQAVSQSIEVYLWGEDKPPAKVFAEVSEEDVELEGDDRDEDEDDELIELDPNLGEEYVDEYSSDEHLACRSYPNCDEDPGGCYKQGWKP
jgi:hypothetical protein